MILPGITEGKKMTEHEDEVAHPQPGDGSDNGGGSEPVIVSAKTGCEPFSWRFT